MFPSLRRQGGPFSDARTMAEEGTWDTVSATLTAAAVVEGLIGWLVSGDSPLVLPLLEQLRVARPAAGP